MSCSPLENVRPVLEALAAAGARPFVVGGAVRDRLLGLPVKDIDIEVFGIGAEALVEILDRFGRVEAVGRSFGVVKLWRDRAELDFALPRRESKTGAGHRGFLVEPDPDMTPKDACARRDFTCNALLWDPRTGEVLDFFGGRADLGSRVLRHTSEHFVEDPLRPLRAMQFAGRFDMTVAPATAALSRTMSAEASALSVERVFGEWEKWAVASVRPSAGLEALRRCGWLPVFPELAGLGAPGPDDLSEASAAWLGVLAGVDCAAAIAARQGLSPDERFALTLAVVGRPLGASGIAALLARIGAPPRLVRRVTPLVAESGFVRDDPSLPPAGMRRLAVRIQPADVATLALLVETDGGAGVEAASSLADRAAALGVLCGPPEPFLSGRDLLALGMAPGPAMGRLLEDAYEAQIDGALADAEDARRFARERLAGRDPARGEE